MKLKTIRLDDQTRSVLLRSNINGNRLTLPGQLQRADYQRVAKAIEAAGGKWNRKEQCHIFPNPVSETMDITEDTVAVTNLQQTYQSFYTPTAVAEQVAEKAELFSGATVLEPSAGTGNLIKAVIARGVFHSDITAVELQSHLTLQLQAISGRVHCGDFLLQSPSDIGTFDRVIMNPPFSRGDDLKHINHALKFVDRHGILVAICAAGPRQREALEPFAAEWLDVPAGSFRESGTDIATAIIVITK